MQELEMRDTRRVKFMEEQHEQQRAASLDKRQKKDAKIEQAKQQAEFQILASRKQMQEKEIKAA